MEVKDHFCGQPGDDRSDMRNWKRVCPAEKIAEISTCRLGSERPKKYIRFRALIDSGASASCVPVEFVEKLGLCEDDWRPQGADHGVHRSFTTANGEQVFALGTTNLLAVTHDFHKLELEVVLLPVHSVILSVGQLAKAGFIFQIDHKNPREAYIVNTHRSEDNRIHLEREGNLWMLPLYIRAVTKENSHAKRKREAQTAEMKRRLRINEMLERSSRPRDLGVGPKVRNELQFANKRPSESGISTDPDSQAEFWTDSDYDSNGLPLDGEDPAEFEDEEWRVLSDTRDLVVDYVADGSQRFQRVPDNEQRVETPDDCREGVYRMPRLSEPEADETLTQHSTSSQRQISSEEFEAIDDDEPEVKPEPKAEWFLKSFISRIIPGCIGIPKSDVKLPRLPIVRQQDLDHFTGEDFSCIVQAIEEGHCRDLRDFDKATWNVSPYQADYYTHPGFPQCFVRAKDIGVRPRYGKVTPDEREHTIEHQAFMLYLDCDRDARGSYFEKVYLPVRLRNRLSGQTTDVYLEVEYGHAHLPGPAVPPPHRRLRRRQVETCPAEVQAMQEVQSVESQWEDMGQPSPLFKAPPPEGSPAYELFDNSTEVATPKKAPPPNPKDVLSKTLQAGYQPAGNLVEDVIGAKPKQTAQQASPPGIDPWGSRSQASASAQRTAKPISRSPAPWDSSEDPTSDPWSSSYVPLQQRNLTRALPEPREMPRRADQSKPPAPSPPNLPSSSRVKPRPTSRPSSLEQEAAVVSSPPGLERRVKASPRIGKPAAPSPPEGSSDQQPQLDASGKVPPPRPPGWKAPFKPPPPGRPRSPTSEELATGSPVPWPSSIAPKPPAATKVANVKQPPPPPDPKIAMETMRLARQAARSRSESPVPDGHSGSW